jgi:Thrombospondin type 1 domain
VEGSQFVAAYSAPTPCTRSCGSGWRLRPSVCVSVAMHTTAPLDVCMQDLQVHDTRITRCATEPCSATLAHWEVGDWGFSSALCDGGVQARSVSCVRNGLTAEEASCGELTDPRQVPAFTSPCTGFAWYTGVWGACSKRCGCGYQRRAAVCVDQSNATVADSFCPHLKPPLEQRCCNAACHVDSVAIDDSAYDASITTAASQRRLQSAALLEDQDGEEDGDNEVVTALRRLRQLAANASTYQDEPRCAFKHSTLM